MYLLQQSGSPEMSRHYFNKETEVIRSATMDMLPMLSKGTTIFNTQNLSEEAISITDQTI